MQARAFPPFVASLALAAALPAQLIVGAEAGGSLWLVEPASGQRHAAGAVAASAGIVGELAHDFITGTVYVSSSSLHALSTVDLASGATTTVGPYGTGIQFMHALDWDVVNGTLWGIPFSDAGLYAIDVNTGAATLVGPTLLTGFVNMAYDLLRDELYAVSTDTDSLYRMDRATGAAQLIGPLVGPTHASSLTFDFVTDTLYLADNQTNMLYTVDELTGTATLVGPLGTGNVLGLAVLPAAGFRREAHGCGSVDLDFTGLPLLGSTIALTVGQWTGAPLLGFGLVPANVPFCSCTVGHEWAATLFGTAGSLTVPVAGQFVGLEIAVQAADLFGTGGCAAPPFAATDTFVFVIG